MSRKRYKGMEDKVVPGTDSDAGHDHSQMEDIFHRKKHYIAMVAAAFFAIGVIISPFTGISGLLIGKQQASSGAAAPDEVGSKVVDFINTYLVKSGGVTLKSVEEEFGLYKVTTEYQGKEIPVYVTKDGRYFVQIQGVVDLDNPPETNQNEQQTQQPQQTVPKADRPKVNLFVMSYCPYGLQMEKAMLPVMKLLGSEADISINWVQYAMHGKKEIDENTRQYCIQKEQGDKYLDYLTCFVQSGDAQKCISEAGIDENSLQSCIERTDEEFNITGFYEDRSTYLGRFPQYPVDAKMAQQYGVRGSPTLIINGQQVSVNRSPEDVKKVICSAFNNPPEECNQTLSSSAESPGIGPLGQESASGSSSSCGG